MKQRRMPLDALTGARFLAAIWVVLYHSSLDFGFAQAFHSLPPTLNTFWNGIVGQGYLAVDFFFLLSGFILAYNYVMPDRTIRGGRRAFWVARIARIYPVYLLGIILGLLIYIGKTHPLTEKAVAISTHLLLVQSWLPTAPPLDLNPPGWSLAAEAVFYAAFPFLVPFFARFGRRAQLLLILEAFLIYLWSLVACTVIFHETSLGSFLTWQSVAKFDPLIRLPEFFIGMSLGLIFVSKKQTDTSVAPRWKGILHDMGIVALLAAIGMVAIFAPARVNNAILANGMALVLLPLLAPLIYLLALQRGLFVTVLSHPFMIWLGEISYGVYILHWPMWFLWRNFVGNVLARNVHHIGVLAIYILVLVAAAGLSFKFIETPARRAIRARWGQPKPAKAVVPQPVPEPVEVGS